METKNQMASKVPPSWAILVDSIFVYFLPDGPHDCSYFFCVFESKTWFLQNNLSIFHEDPLEQTWGPSDFTESQLEEVP
jgi:hypothetical protein